MAFDVWAARRAMAEVRIKSVEELAKRAGLSGVYVRNVFNGLLPSDKAKAKIAAALGVDEGTLWKPAAVAE